MLRMHWVDRTLAVAALVGTALAAWSTLAQAPGDFSTLSTAENSNVQRRRADLLGRPWIDVRCPSMAGGAVGDGAHDDTAAIQAAFNAAVTNNWPVHLSAGTYKVTSTLNDRLRRSGEPWLSADFRGRDARRPGRCRRPGSGGAQCSGGVPGAPANCFYFKQEGVLFVLADTPDYAVVIGKDDFLDAHNTIKLDHLNVNNRSTDFGAGGCRFNFVLDSDLWVACVSAGGGAGLAFEQTQFSRISGSGTAQGTGGRGPRARKRLQLCQYVSCARSRSVADLSQHHDAA